VKQLDVFAKQQETETMSMENLKARIAALEAKLGIKASQPDARTALAAEIKSLEKRLGMYAGKDEDEDDKDACATCASEKDPSGIEEQITQDKFTEVEKITHGEELATFPSTEEAGRKSPGLTVKASEYNSRLKSASERLDKVADYLEKHGRKELALRIDKIADAVDSQISRS
jgi:hypothetical protein